ncbi:helix-turn-helix transcriptional regulator [Phytohabitans rumicis]|uniref:helix-turn-helix transcriptional regulator n=1 Tax=Phytohabitans rumicis TaxID=1076125 RepID=UPI0031E95CCC
MTALVGRDIELARLRDVLRATAGGTGGCLVITGPPGIGKTRLLAEMIRHGSAAGLAVASGQAIELDRVAPLKTVVSALREARPRPVDLSGLREHQGDRLWYVERIGEALEEYAAAGPLLVVVDDAHWTDEFSALALRVLVPRLSSSPVRWVLARRPAATPSPAHEAIDWLVREGAEQLSLAPLDEAAVGALCSNVLGAEADATVLALAAEGHGNPFLLEQYFTALQAAGQILVAEGVASVVGADLPADFRAAAIERLYGLSPQAIRLLQAGSVFGRPFTVHAAAQLWGLRAVELLTAVDEAVATGVLRARGATLTFAHDLLRQAIYDDLSGPVRAAMHGEAADVVRQAGGTPPEIAEHLLLDGQTGDDGAVQVLRAAAEEVADRAPSTAADLILRARDRLGDPDGRLRLSVAAVGLLASAGRLPEARELGEAALRHGLDAETEATVLLGLAEALKHAGQNQVCVDYVRRALAGSPVPPAVRARLHAVEAHALLYVHDLPGAEQAGAEADRLGTAHDEPAASAFGSAARSVVAQAQGRLADAVAHARHAVQVADRAGGAALHRHPRIWLGGALTAVDRFAEAEEVIAVGRHEADELGTAWSQPLWAYYNASLATARGRLDDAVAEAEAGIRIAQQLSAWQLCLPLLGMLTRVAVARAQMPVAREHLRAMQRLLDEGITSAPEDVGWSFAVFQAADGQPEAALATLEEIHHALPGRLLLFANDPGAAADLVRVALRAKEPAVAGAAVDAARALAELNPAVPSLPAAAAHAEGLLKRDAVALRDAVDRYRATPRTLARISAMEDLAVVEHDAGHRSGAVELLEDAVAEATTCGARRAVERMERRLRRFGVRSRVKSSPGGAPATPLGGLTATELAITRMVAQGMSNREIAEKRGCSPHTVDSHLRNIFQKVGVNSRVALTNALHGK